MPNMAMKKNPMPSQAPDVRNHNFDEVALGYTAEMAVDEAQRCLNCKNMPCVSGCPVRIRIPDFIEKPIAQLSYCTSPVALLILGASFKIGTLGNDVRDLAIIVASRLLVVPGVILPLAMLMGIRGIEFVTLISIFATPCAVASFAMAQQLGSNAELAGNAVVVSSALSCFTLFFWIVLFQVFGVF